MAKSKLKTDIFNYNTPEFYINMKDIPIKGSDSRGDFVREEKRKCREGINVNGINIPGSLYFHLNYYKLEGDSKTQRGKKEIFLPTLRDNEWVVFNDYEKAIKEGKAYTLFGLRQCGKCLRINELVLTPDGWKEIGTLNVGDVLYGKDGKSTKVTGVFKQGKLPVYRMYLIDGRYIDSSLNHKWEVIDSNNKTHLKTTEELLNTKLKSKHKRSGENFRYKIPSINPVEFEKKELPINPYLMGLLLGDGTTCHPTPSLSTIDQQIVDNVKEILGEDFQITVDKNEMKTHGYHCRHYFKYIGEDKYASGRQYNKLYNKLKELGLGDKTSYNKFIPEIYKFSSVQDRIDLLAGIIDSDGWVSEKGNIEVKLVNQKLAEEVLSLARSLGIRGEIMSKMTDWSSNGNSGTSWVSRVYLRTDLPISKLDRKLNRIVKKRKRTNAVSIDRIEYIEDDDCVCISVDNEDHIYLTKDFIPTHNTEMETSLCLRELSLFQSTEALALFAGDNFKKNFTKKLRIAIEHGDPFIIIPNIDKDWSKDEIRFGLTKADNTIDLRSTLFIYNTQEGKKIQVASGKTPSFFLIDEAGVSPFREVYETVKPALLSDLGGLRCSPFLTLTGGEADKAKDAEDFIKFPIEDEQLIFNYNGKNLGGRFLDGRYRKDCKIDSTISKYTGVKTNTWIDDFPIKVTDFELALSKIEKEKTDASKSPDKKALHLKRIFFPLTLEDVFLSENENPFPREALEQQKEFLLSNPVGQNIELFRGQNLTVQYKFSNKFPISKYPVVSGDSVDAPIVMYDSPERFKGQKGIHVIGIDGFADDETSSSDSLGSIYVFRKFHSDLSDPFSGSMVASYTARPKSMREFNEISLMLAEFYDATIMYEHVNAGFKDFFDGKNKYHLLIPTPSLTKEISPNSNAKNTTGLRATPGIQKHALNLSLDYLNEELITGQLGTTRILDPILIEELLAYDGVKNTDRYIAFSMGIEALYMYKKYTTIITNNEEIEVKEKPIRKNAMGIVMQNRQAPFTSSNNPFGI